MATIKELEQQIKELRKAEESEAKAALAAIPLKYTWIIDWESEHVFYCGVKMTDATRARIDQWCADYPNASPPWDYERQRGMKYVLIGNKLLQVGGGTVVLNLGHRDPFSYEPAVISDTEAEMLRAGTVPDTLRRADYKEGA